MKLLALDAGFGDVKYLGGGVVGKFPTAVAYERSGMAVGDAEGVMFEGRRYLVGQSALHNDPFSTRSIDFLIRYSPVLLDHAIKMVFNDVPDELLVAVGLPVSYYTPEVRAQLQKRLEQTVVNDVVRAQRVMVYPQGVGAYQDWFSSSGETGDSFVIDVGFNTVDLVAIRNGAPSRSLSGMLDQAGISRPIGELRDYLQRQHKVDLAPQQAKEIFNAREFRLYGNAVDVSAPIREILEDYAEWLFRLIEDRFEKSLRSVERIVVVGGGAYVLAKYIPQRYQGILTIPESPEFANCRGFHLMAQCHTGGSNE